MGNSIKKLIAYAAVAAIVLYLIGAYFGVTKTLFIIISAALIDSINPCAISILLITLAFLFSLGKLRNEILAIGSVYISGIFLIYVCIGLGVLQALSVFNVPHFMARVGAVIIILFGVLELINNYFPRFPIKLAIPDSAHSKIGKMIHRASVPTAFGMGVAVGLYEFPCTGGPYLMVLGLLHDRGTYLSGFLYLLLYNLIFVLPLILILIAAGNKRILERYETLRKEGKNTRLYMGLVMIILGLVILLL